MIIDNTTDYCFDFPVVHLFHSMLRLFLQRKKAISMAKNIVLFKALHFVFANRNIDGTGC